MSEQPDDLTRLADALRTLAPRSPTFDREALMFRAGRAAAPRRWLWPSAAAALALVAMGLGAALWLRPAPPPEVRVVHVRVEVPAPRPEPPETAPVVTEPPEPAPNGDYLILRRRVLDQGVDALAAPDNRPVAAPAVKLDDLLGLPPDALREPWLQKRQIALKSGDAS